MKNSDRYLLGMLISGVIAGLLQNWFGETSDYTQHIEVAETILFSLLIFGWCRFHSEENNLHSTRGYQVLAALIPPVGVPIYFFRFFGIKRGAFLTLKSAVFAVVFLTSYAISYVMPSYV